MIAPVGTNLASVRKHCARWDTGADPGWFRREPFEAPMVPPALSDCAIEVVAMLTGGLGTFIIFDDFQHSQNRVRIRESLNSIRAGITTSGSGGEQQVQVGGVLGHWYHMLAWWEQSGAGTARFRLFVNGVSIGETPYYANLPWVGGVNSYVELGGNALANGRIALVRYYAGEPPPASVLYDLPYITSGLPGLFANLRCQWDMRPGYGDTAVDSEAVFDIPWVAVDQPNAIYSSYRYTGQCRADRWTPP